MNITEKLKINNELFGEKKQKQGTMNNLDPVIQLIPPNITA